MLGYVDECKHTRLFEGLCTVCGANTRQEQTAGSNKRPREDDSSGVCRITMADLHSKALIFSRVVAE